MPLANVERVGVALSRVGARRWDRVVIVCGLAGALRDDLPTGTVLIPEYVLQPDGERLTCDAAMVDALIDASRALGFEPCCSPMLTSRSIICGAERGEWSRRGYASVDMEAGCIRAPRVAVLRVVLDTPQRELSAAWREPRSALFHAECWKQLPWLMRAAPRGARRAADIVGRMLKTIA